MQHNALMELYVDELKDLYDAENRLVKALPKVAKTASSDKLRSAVEEHLEQTRGHVDRLKEIFDNLGEKPTGKKCAGMIGILKEGDEIMDEDFEENAMDAALISAAQRVEHY
jgi:ferritin-like metal-binding protein YciE